MIQTFKKFDKGDYPKEVKPPGDQDGGRVEI